MSIFETFRVGAHSPRAVMREMSCYRMRQDDPFAEEMGVVNGMPTVDSTEAYNTPGWAGYDPKLYRALGWTSGNDVSGPFKGFDWAGYLHLTPDQMRKGNSGESSYQYNMHDLTPEQKDLWQKEWDRRHTILNKTDDRRSYQAFMKGMAFPLAAGIYHAAAAAAGGGGAPASSTTAASTTASTATTPSLIASQGFEGAGGSLGAGWTASGGGAATAGTTTATSAGTGAKLAAAYAKYKPYANAALQAYNAYAAADEAKKGSKGSTEQYRLPYGNEYLAPLIRYILDQQARIYNSRQNIYGGPQLSLSPIMALLAGVPTNYSGVGKP